MISSSRRQGCPQCEQQPAALVPARMQGSTSLTGKVAVWLPRKGWVGMVQTERLLRVWWRGTSAPRRGERAAAERRATFPLAWTYLSHSSVAEQEEIGPV